MHDIQHVHHSLLDHAEITAKARSSSQRGQIFFMTRCLATADEHSVSSSGKGGGGQGAATLRARLGSLGSDPSSSLSRQPNRAAACGVGKSSGGGANNDADALHISSALLQHASEQLHRHLDQGTLGRRSSERLLPPMIYNAKTCQLVRSSAPSDATRTPVAWHGGSIKLL